MDQSNKSSRRRFIKTFTLLTATSSLLGKAWENTVVAQVLPKGGTLRIRLTQFPALQTSFGSVRIGMNRLVPAPGVSATCRKPQNTIPSLYPVVISRATGSQFFAVSSRCPHEDCAVSRLSPATASGNLVCSGHGSLFRIDGSFVNGSGPANGPLDSYRVDFDGADTLRVQLPEIFFEFSTMEVAPANSNKLSLNFLASTNLAYEVWYQQTLGGAATNVPFSTTPNGTNQFTVSGIDDYVTVYVERQGPAGYYQIAMRVIDVDAAG